MGLLITRRSLGLGLAMALGVGAPRSGRAAETTISEIEQRNGGRLGVFAFDTGTGRMLANREDERFTLCSTFKGLLAAFVLWRVQNGEDSLSHTVFYNEQDLFAVSPVTTRHARQGGLTVGRLCQAAVEVSDNTAAVLLTRRVGGPAALTRFLRDIGDTVTRCDRFEPGCNTYDGVLDTTTPRAIATTAQTILLGSVLSPAHRTLLESWMIASKPGLTRLRAVFPHDWGVGDKTGTSGAGEVNDYAIVRPPGRAPLFIAAYYDAPKLDQAAGEAVLREVGATFVNWVSL